MTANLQRLARQNDIDWLSYYFAEFVCAQQGCELDSILGYSAALVSEASLAGNVCVELAALSGKPLFQALADEASASPVAPALDTWLAELESSDCVGEPGALCPLILEEDRLYLQRYWHYEDFVAGRILTMLQVSESAAASGSPRQTDDQNLPASDMDTNQEAAIDEAGRRSFVVISGGPGSGKTSTVIRILTVLLTQNPDCRVALAAPTGKAAARMMDSIQERMAQLDIAGDLKPVLPEEAQTIHRLLGYRHGNFIYHRQRRLPVDCVIVDEASMIDLKLMYQLLAALPDDARLILLGDRDQLASVAAGNVLADITGQGFRNDTGNEALAAAIRLLQSSYRFGHDSAIGALARQVNQGDTQAAVALLQQSHADLHWYDEDGEMIQQPALSWLLDRYQGIFDSDTPGQALQVYEQTRLLCATNTGPLGIESMNQRVSAALLQRNDLPAADQFAGLPIMITRNFRDLGLFNGDTGILWAFGNELRACFRRADGRIHDLSINRLPEFTPAWATTVHKSQGSEFDSVLMLLPADSQVEVLSRELLYTAITRARQQFLLHGSQRVIKQAIQRVTQRHSGLAGKLGWRQALD